MYTPDSCIPSTVQFITELLQKYTCTKNLTQGSCTIMQTRRKEKYMILYNPITQSTNPYKIQKAVSAKGCDEQNTPFLHCTFFFLPFQALIRFLLHDWRTLLSLAAGSLFFFFSPPSVPRVSFFTTSSQLYSFTHLIYVLFYAAGILTTQNKTSLLVRSFVAGYTISSMKCTLTWRWGRAGERGGWYNFRQLSRTFL